MDATQEAVLDWLNTGEVGISSKCMAMWLAFGKRVSATFGNHPHDPDDMDRCLKLLDRVPDLRERLPKMAEVSYTWAALVERWAEIEAMQMGEIGLNWTKARSAPKTYAMMRAVIDGAKKRPNAEVSGRPLADGRA